MDDELQLPWTVRTAEAAALGISRKELRGPGYVPVRRGVRVPAGVDALDPDVRIAAVARGLPEHACIGGWAAARLHEAASAVDDLRVFDGHGVWDRGPGRTPLARVLVCAPGEARISHRRDARVFRSVVPTEEATMIAGIRATSALRTAFDLARLLPRRWAVSGVDRLLHLGVVDLASLVSRVDAAKGWVGVPSARQVLTLVDGAAESPQESLLRLVWIDAGFARPRGNVVVRDRAGGFLARVDLLDEQAGVVGEYDGGDHASSERRASDHRRHERLEHVGLVVVRAASEDVATEHAREAWARRLRRAYAIARRPGRPRDWIADP